jgi:hypothetical protein
VVATAACHESAESEDTSPLIDLPGFGMMIVMANAPAVREIHHLRPPSPRRAR